MKKTFLLSYLLFLLSLMPTLSGSDSQEIVYVKQYVSVDQIKLSENTIEVEIDGCCQPVESLHVDQRGIFVVFSQGLEMRVPPGTWQCPRCLRLNSIKSKTCQYCKWPEK